MPAAVRALIQQKADVNAAAADGTTALHWAVRADDLAMVEALLAAGAERQSARIDMVSLRSRWLARTPTPSYSRGFWTRAPIRIRPTLKAPPR